MVAGVFMQSVNKRRLIAVIVLVLVVIMGVVALLHKPSKPSSTPQTNTYTDPYSHETVTETQGKAPDIFGTTAQTPIYLGFDKLIDHGVSYDQVGNLKTAFYQYSKTKNSPIKEVSLDVDHIKSIKEGRNFYLTFKVVFDRKDIYQAKLDYTGLSAIRLYLYDNSGNLIFDSQSVNSQAAE
ncbi:hypothetical protein KW794_00145 [Candidatus Saccharibacteria bacterium]|nr:hypothetical protein [Candidatus Saccharibacteria bacterium]